jgi:DNA-binding response OmpR family regulator
MAHVAIRFLILHKELRFALNIKRTLEQMGGFEVLTFTTLETALTHLRRQPQNIVLVDMNIITLADLPKFRAIQPDILMIGSPNKPQLAQANLDALVDTPISARELLPILRGVLERHREQMPPAVDDFIQQQTRQSFQQSVNTETGTMEFVIQDEPETPSESSVQLFQQLAAEEPPIPSPLENGTVSDFRSIMDDTIPAQAQRTQPIKPPEATQPNVSSFAEDALRVVSDATMPLSKLNPVVSTEFPDTQGIEPLPSWVDHLKRYVNEPDFLQSPVLKQAPSMTDDEIEGQTPTFSIDAPIKSPDAPPPPPNYLPEMLPNKQDDHMRETLETRIPPTLDAPDHAGEDADLLEDSQIIQMALNFTQASLGMTAEFSLLSHHDQIVAHSGSLPLEEVEDISQLIAQDWQAEEGQARVRFITLPSSGKDYMIYSRQTERDLTLSLIFNGGTPFNLIRKQGERLLDALNNTPELPAKTETVLDILQAQEIKVLEQQAAEEISQAVETTAEIAREHGEEHTRALMQPSTPVQPAITENKHPYTLIWLTRSPDVTLSDRVVRLLTNELEMQLQEMDWTVEDLQIYEDYIYLIAYIPLGEASTHTAIADVKERSARIVETIDSSVTGDRLWADAYCALSPAREMDSEEIQYFINFART